MRKLSGLIIVVITMFGALVACGDNADALADGCKEAGGDKSACECVRTRAKDEMTDDQIQEGADKYKKEPDNQYAQQINTIFSECINGTGDGTGDGSTDTGS